MAIAYCAAATLGVIYLSIKHSYRADALTQSGLRNRETAYRCSLCVCDPDVSGSVLNQLGNKHSETIWVWSDW